MFLVSGIDIEVDVSQFVSVPPRPAARLEALRATYCCDQKRTQIAIAEIASENVSRFDIRLLPRPIISVRGLATASNSSKFLSLARSSLANAQTFDLGFLDFDSPFSMVASGVGRESKALRNESHEPPEHDESFLEEVTRTYTRPLLANVDIPFIDHRLCIVPLVIYAMFLPDILEHYRDILIHRKVFSD
jgi:hypothetical protein